MPEPQVYDTLNKRWKSVCSALLGDEIGELSDYSEWLYWGNGPRNAGKTASGREIVFADQNYSVSAPKLSFDEVDFDKRYEPLGINEIKDIDSIFEAISDRVAYTGNIVLGNSRFVDNSTTITECFYVYHSERVAFSKYVAYSSRGGYSEDIFGCYGFGPVQFAIKSGAAWDVKRAFCVSKAEFSSDIFFSHGLMGCQDCLFCFNLKNVRHAIGNRILEPKKHLELKKKLISEMQEKLLKDKKLPLIFEIASREKPDYAELKKVFTTAPKEKVETLDKGKIEKAFSETTNVVLGKALSPIDKYGGWLASKSSIRLEDARSCLSGKPLILPNYAWFLNYPRDRLLTQEEADFSGGKLQLAEAELDSISLENASSMISKIAYFSPFWLTGTNRNNIDSPMNIDSADCYRGILYLLTKCSGFCFSPRSCDYSFGCREGRHNSFCINSHYSTKVTRCFEIDSCSNCTGCYFCHNCENVHDSMFCFNVKNKRYAIGNIEVGRGKFTEAKKLLLDWISKELEKKNGLDLDVYNLLEKASRGK